MTPPKPSRRRLTEAEWEAVLERARSETLRITGMDKPLLSRTGRRRSWWQRGWRRG